jgi:hypothetical protein
MFEGDWARGPPPPYDRQPRAPDPVQGNSNVTFSIPQCVVAMLGVLPTRRFRQPAQLYVGVGWLVSQRVRNDPLNPSHRSLFVSVSFVSGDRFLRPSLARNGSYFTMRPNRSASCFFNSSTNLGGDVPASGARLSHGNFSPSCVSCGGFSAQLEGQICQTLGLSPCLPKVAVIALSAACLELSILRPLVSIVSP